MLKQFAPLIFVLTVIFFGFSTAGHILEVAMAKKIWVTVIASRENLNAQHRTVPRIEYTYRVDGKTYTSTRICSTPDFMGGGGHHHHRRHHLSSSLPDIKCYENPRELLAKFPERQYAKGYYNPLNPARSFLIAKYSTEHILMTGLFFLLIPFAGFKYVRRLIR